MYAFIVYIILNSVIVMIHIALVTSKNKLFSIFCFISANVYGNTLN